MLFLFQKMSIFNKACEDLLEQRKNTRIVNGIAYYRSVPNNKQGRDLGYLVPLRYSENLKGPVQISMDEGDTFSVGRDQKCNFVLPVDMFLDKENLKHDKE